MLIGSRTRCAASRLWSTRRKVKVPSQLPPTTLTTKVTGASHERVGFIGVGNMGSGMVTNLVRKGFAVTMFDADRSKAEAVKVQLAHEDSSTGEVVRVAESAEDVASECSTVCLSLPGEHVGEKVLFGEKGVVRGKACKMVVDHSTVSVKFTKQCYERFGVEGVTYVDAPVSGGPEGANKGTLSIMVGGTQDSFGAVHAPLSAMGSLVAHMGPSGAGTAAKLINQLLTGIHIAAAAEAYQLARSLGISDIPALLNLLQRSWGNSTMLQRCGAKLVKAEQEGMDVLSRSGAPIRNFEKDFTMIQSAAEGAKLSLRLTSMAQSQFNKAGSMGLSQWDIAAMVQLFPNHKGQK